MTHDKPKSNRNSIKDLSSRKGVVEYQKSPTQKEVTDRQALGEIQENLTQTAGKRQIIPNRGSRQMLPFGRTSKLR